MIENQVHTPDAELMPVMVENLPHIVGDLVTVKRDAIPASGIKALEYTGTLVKVTGTRAYVRRAGCKTARPFVLGPSFRFLAP